jgi:hypothetical protein
MEVSSLGSETVPIAQSQMRLQAAFAASRAAVTRYIVTLEPTDGDSALEEMNSFETAVNAQQRTGDARFDKFLPYIRNKLPAYRREANAIVQQTRWTAPSVT